MISGILFDMDGTIFDTERLYYNCWKRVAADRGYEIPDALLDQMRGASLTKGAELFTAYFHGEKDFWEERGCRQQYVFAEIEAHGVPFRKGLRELFDYLKANEIKIALATSTVAEVAGMYLEKSGLLPYFDAVITGDMVENGKPAPDIFLLAAEKLGLAPSECAVAEDSLNGLKAGRVAGCRVFYLPDISLISDADIKRYADETFASLDRIVPYLKVMGCTKACMGGKCCG